jgi:hypothetical protein
MFIFASLLQGIPRQQEIGLVEQASVVMKRLAETAIRLVTTNGEIAGCMEGLECMIIEGIFQVNAGNLRRAWLAFRRAMLTAQLMKMDRPNPPPIKIIHPDTRMTPTLMWFRIVQMDRFLSLMLGLSQGSPNSDMNYDAPGETPLFKLERANVAISGRIIERNRNDPLVQDINTTQELDSALLNASNIMPDEFWLLPDFSTIHRYSQEAGRQTIRIAHQLHHYNLVHLLHLPYLLRNDEQSYHAYAKVTCVNASRELLSRCVAFRSFNNNMTACRTVDFLALMAALTILLAHMDSHRQSTQNVLAHQRLSDRAMVKQVFDNMERLSKLTSDTLLSKSANLLECLLQVESEVMRGETHTSHTALSYLEQECSVLQLPIPYFGIIKIGREGIISTDWPTQPASGPVGIHESPSAVNLSNHVFSFGSRLNPTQNPHAPYPDIVHDKQPFPCGLEGQMAISPEDGDAQEQQILHPSLTAGLEDWTFQGVDAAFFDSLMRHT